METFKMNRGLKSGIAGACTALLLCSGAAFAQSAGSDFSQPLDKASGGGTVRRGAPSRAADQGQGMSAGESRMVIQSSGDGDDTYQITVSNGEVEAKVNGKAVPAERIRRSKDKIEILDEHGKVMKSFDVSLGSGGSGARAVTRGRNFQPVQPAAPQDAFGQPMAGAIEMTEPKVMIGITMGEPSEALAGHLGIKQDEAVLVEKVYEGLPAEKAGLKSQDIIVEVDGVRPVTQQKFRETINKHDPGEKVQLKVLRKGEEHKLTVELKKFDSEKLGMKGGIAGVAPDVFQAMPNWDTWNNGQFKELFKDNPEAKKKFEDAMRNAWRVNPDAHGQAMVLGNGPEGELKFMPFSDARRLDDMQSQLDKKIAELDEKLAKINDQMQRLEKLLDKMSEKGTR